MGYSKKETLVSRDPISGLHVSHDIDADGKGDGGEHSAEVLKLRARARQEATEQGINADSNHTLAITPEADHPVLKEALARLNSEKRDPKPGARYHAIHGTAQTEPQDEAKDAVVPVKTAGKK